MPVDGVQGVLHILHLLHLAHQARDQARGEQTLLMYCGRMSTEIWKPGKRRERSFDFMENKFLTSIIESSSREPMSLKGFLKTFIYLPIFVDI